MANEQNPIKAMLDRAEATDLRRQEQIKRQKESIDRLLELLGAAEDYIRDLGKGDAWAKQRQQIEATYSQGSDTPPAQGD